MTTEPINDGGPAFPQFQTGKSVLSGEQVVLTFGGMSLRDYFAAAALNGFLSANAKFADNDKPDSKAFSVAAYTVADAMIRQRSL